MTNAEIYRSELDKILYDYYYETGNVISKDVLEQILTIIFKFIYIDNNEKGVDNNE